LLVPSGDIPTISYLPPINLYDYAEQGAFADITSSVKNYSDIMSYVPEELWSRVSVGGSVLGVPSLNTAGKYDIIYREDWLNKLGLKIPATIDEFTEVMKAFTEEDPDGNGENDTYGYGNYTLNMFYGAFGGAPGYYHVKGDVA
jgi:ABC-type glycerol-3-phosphate transport system substrate-binding protein